MKRNEVISALLIPCGTGYSKEYRSSYIRYRVILQSEHDNNVIERLFDKEELKGLSYWSSRGKTMSMTCWGTSQKFAAQLALARWLGWEEKGKDWSEFTRMVENKIKSL